MAALQKRIDLCKDAAVADLPFLKTKREKEFRREEGIVIAFTIHVRYCEKTTRTAKEIGTLPDKVSWTSFFSAYTSFHASHAAMASYNHNARRRVCVRQRQREKIQINKINL